MKEGTLDLFLVPLGLALMVGYHFWLFHQIKRCPRRTVIGINSIHRLIWVQAMMEDPSKNGVLAVQTLRNNIMASSLLASAVIMLSSVIAMLMSRPSAEASLFLYGDNSHLGFSIKVFSILVCFLVAFLFNVQSVRYYSQASILINVPSTKILSWSPSLTMDYVVRSVNRGSYFWSLGSRAFYLSFPLFLWLFGPIPMFLCCIVLVLMLYSLDMSAEFGPEGESDDEKEVAKLPA